MRVRCVSALPTQEQIEKLGPKYYAAQGFFLKPGQEFVVLGLMLAFDTPIWGTGAWAYLSDSDTGQLFRAPLLLFEVIDSHGSCHWELHDDGDGTVQLAPEPLNRQYFADDLSNDDPVAIADWARLKELMFAEADK